jgi:hypothetical protein
MLERSNGGSITDFSACVPPSPVLLCAERCRAEVVEGGGLSLVLDAMQRFPWDGNVQMKANWLIAIMASNYAAALGEQGAVEMAITGMRACEEDYQVQTSGIRCLQNLITGNADNRARAKAAGAIKLLEDSLERNPEDGQLQYRGAALLERLNAVEAATVAKVAETDRKLKTGASSARLVGAGSFSVRAQSKGAEADSGRVRTSDSIGSGAGAMPAAAARAGGISPTKGASGASAPLTRAAGGAPAPARLHRRRDVAPVPALHTRPRLPLSRPVTLPCSGGAGPPTGGIPRGRAAARRRPARRDGPHARRALRQRGGALGLRCAVHDHARQP